MDLSEYERLNPHASVDGIIFLTPNTHCAWRVETLHTKEPDTIAWIDTMQRGETLFDVGANMGQYSLYAARRGVNVHAFEPESQNFALLCRNIAVNRKSDLVTAWPLALADDNGPDEFHVTTVMPGSSCHSLGEEVDYHLQPKKFPFKQGTWACQLDEFVHRRGIRPDYIKIDVDGFEHNVLLGAKKTLSSVKSVLVEINTSLAEHRDIFAMMKEHGLHPDMATADIARRKSGPFEGIGNVIFYRNTAEEAA